MASSRRLLIEVGSYKVDLLIGWLSSKPINMLDLSHKKLEVYQIAMKLLVEVYKLTKNFPKEEQYGIIQQIRRAVVSICSNIAEGAARVSKMEKRRFFEVSRSSAVESNGESLSSSFRLG